MNVTRKMLGAAHDILLKRGLMLSGEMLEEIYLAMDALANRSETSGSLPTTPAAERPDHRKVMEQALEALKAYKPCIVKFGLLFGKGDEAITALRNALKELP